MLSDSQRGLPYHVVVMGTNKMASEAADLPTNANRRQEERDRESKNKRKHLSIRHKDVELRAREKGILKTFNENFLREECDDVEDTDILNLPNKNIEMLGDFSLMLLTRLKVCNLANNFLADICPLSVCTQLVKLDVSNNQVG